MTEPAPYFACTVDEMKRLAVVTLRPRMGDLTLCIVVREAVQGGQADRKFMTGMKIRTTREELTAAFSDVDRTAGRKPRGRYTTDQASAFYEEVSGYSHSDDPPDVQAAKQRIHEMRHDSFGPSIRGIVAPPPPIPDEVLKQPDYRGPVVHLGDQYYAVLGVVGVILVLMISLDGRGAAE